jgi:diadenosine tetraphosphate (Ap4A) HIT family hydrolase
MSESEFSNPSFVKCKDCGFELWEPIAELSYSYLGLYNDARFPGRCILSLKEHWEDFSRLPYAQLCGFVSDAQQAAQAILKAIGERRINYAILGNTVPHVHFHIIPRYPEVEEQPNKAPWNDPRPLARLSNEEHRIVKAKIARALHHSSSSSAIEHVWSRGET